MAADRKFRAMGSDGHVIVVGGRPDLADQAIRRVEDLEARWSRFRASSEVSALNRCAGTFVDVSLETVTLIRRAVEAWRITGGSFDPTVLGDVMRAGYVRSWDPSGPAPQPQATNLGIGAEHICIQGTSVRLPAHIGFDPGGLGKGLAADLVCAELLAAGASGACVNLGGDLRVAGEGPAGAGWTVAVEHPWAAEPVAQLGIADGAVATSTTLRRRWLVDGEARHHLIDPQTGQPSDTDLTLACVVAGEAWMAETLAKAVILAGSAHPFDIVGGTGAEAVVVDDRGIVSASAGLARYLGGRALPPRLGADFADGPRPVPASDRMLGQ